MVPVRSSDESEKGVRRWSQQVTRHSDALDLEPGVFTWDDPRRIARSLRDSAEASTRRKSTPYASAMSMLSFYINRAGSNLGEERRQVLQAAKRELKRLYGRDANTSGPAADPRDRSRDLHSSARRGM
jgi:hypothetical protein